MNLIVLGMWNLLVFVLKLGVSCVCVGMFITNLLFTLKKKLFYLVMMLITNLLFAFIKIYEEILFNFLFCFIQL